MYGGSTLLLKWRFFIKLKVITAPQLNSTSRKISFPPTIKFFAIFSFSILSIFKQVPFFITENLGIIHPKYFPGM